MFDDIQKLLSAKGERIKIKTVSVNRTSLESEDIEDYVKSHPGMSFSDPEENEADLLDPLVSLINGFDEDLDEEEQGNSEIENAAVNSLFFKEYSEYKKLQSSEGVFEEIIVGKLICRPELTAICYEEDELSGMDNTNTVVFFTNSSPEVINIMRTGNFNSVVSLEQDKEFISTSYSDRASVQTVYKAVKIANNISRTGGSLTVDYLSKAEKAPIVRTLINMLIQPF